MDNSLYFILTEGSGDLLNSVSQLGSIEGNHSKTSGNMTYHCYFFKDENLCPSYPDKLKICNIYCCVFMSREY